MMAAAATKPIPSATRGLRRRLVTINRRRGSSWWSPSGGGLRDHGQGRPAAIRVGHGMHTTTAPSAGVVIVRWLGHGAPAGPCGPVGPAGPWGPIGPWGPVGP
jgi:hypothetical protein